MAKSNVRCSMGHTELHPGKTEARAFWMHDCSRTSDIITISQGALDDLCLLRHTGDIHVCDIDPGVIESTNYLKGSKGARYTSLNLRTARLLDFSDAVRLYVERHGVRKLGAVDCDLACSVDKAWEIAKPSVELLHAKGYKGLFLLTFRNGRDGHGWNATKRRVAELTKQLPASLRSRVTYQAYRSDWVGRFATRENGSSMVVVKIQF